MEKSYIDLIKFISKIQYAKTEAQTARNNQCDLSTGVSLLVSDLLVNIFQSTKS